MSDSFYDAVVFGEFKKVNEWIKRDSKIVNSRDEYGFTALHGVAGEDQVEMARLLISHKADVNATNDDGITPLHLAAYESTIEILIHAGANINARSKRGETPLITQTAEEDGLEAIEVLLRHGADVNLRDILGHSALDIAISREDEEKVELLKEFGGK